MTNKKHLKKNNKSNQKNIPEPDYNYELSEPDENSQTHKITNSNRYNFMSDSDDSDNNSDSDNKKIVNKKQQNNRFNFSDSDDEIIIEKKEQKNSKLVSNNISQPKKNFDTNTKKSINHSTLKSTNTPIQTHTLFSEKMEVHIGGKKLLEESDIVINQGMKYFVLGQNGIGKTTLLKEIYSKIQFKTDVLMLDQDIQIESTEQKISEFILDADIELHNNKKRMEQLEKIEEMSDKESEEYEKLSELVYLKEWDKYESESKRILDGLGFKNPDIPVSILSGGKRMILAIGKALLRKPDILIMDEPTNHLDLDVVIWLTNYLDSYPKSLIVITHQIGLVNSLADVIWYIGNPELTGNKVYTIRGKYDKLIKFLEQTQKETTKNYDKFIKRVEELRKKSTPKKEVEEFIKKQNVPRPPKPYQVTMEFDNVIELSTRNIIEFQNVSFGYPNNKNIYQDLSIRLGMGSRMILVGSNGIGKTTFFKLINGLIEPTEGYIIKDDRLRIGYYNQQIIDNLPLDLTPIQYLQQLNPQLDQNQCRTILGKLGIKKIDNLDLPTNKIMNLSGGQKARVSFSSVQMLKPHLILLDEPTNHLDLESIDGLIKGINEFNGGICIITHDIYLIESIVNADIYEVKNSNIIKFPGEFSDYCDYIYSRTN